MRKKYLKNVGCLKNGMPILYFLKYSSPCFLKHPAIHIGRGEKKQKKKKKKFGNKPSNLHKKKKLKEFFFK